MHVKRTSLQTHTFQPKRNSDLSKKTMKYCNMFLMLLYKSYKLLIAPSSKRTSNHSSFSVTPDMLCVQDIVADSPGSYTICWSATPSSWHGNHLVNQLLLEKRNTNRFPVVLALWVCLRCFSFLFFVLVILYPMIWGIRWTSQHLQGCWQCWSPRFLKP